MSGCDTPAMATRIPYKQLDEIPGWFRRMDMELFRLLLDSTEEHLGGGDLAELGAYLGKSAALMGCALQPGETFTVIDLFSAEAPSDDNQSENEEQYPELSQEAFEGYYRTIHDELPVVVRAPSQEIVDHAAHGTHRFVHIDASHLYEHVVDDIAAARKLLKPVASWSSTTTARRTPLASRAAVWRETTNDLTPFALTQNKLYATFGDSRPWFELVKEWLEARLDLAHGAAAGCRARAGPRTTTGSQAEVGCRRTSPAGKVAPAQTKRGLLARLTRR